MCVGGYYKGNEANCVQVAVVELGIKKLWTACATSSSGAGNGVIK